MTSSPGPTHELWLLRHAKTVADPPPGGTDHERRLAPRGRRDAEALGRRLAEGSLGLKATLPGLVLTSTATRTRQTTELVLAALGEPPEVDARRSLYGASPDEVVEQLRGLDEDLASVMVVGHNPTAMDLVVSLAGSGPLDQLHHVERHGFPTCGLLVVSWAGPWAEVALGTATLIGVVTPPY